MSVKLEKDPYKRQNRRKQKKPFERRAQVLAMYNL